MCIDFLDLDVAGKQPKANSGFRPEILQPAQVQGGRVPQNPPRDGTGKLAFPLGLKVGSKSFFREPQISQVVCRHASVANPLKRYAGWGLAAGPEAAACGRVRARARA